MTNLNENLDVFEEEATEETTATEQKAGETKEAETKGETKATEGKTDEAKDAEPPSAEEEKLVPIVALHDERRKAKLYKEELEQYKSKYDSDDNEPDPADDPEAYKSYVKKKAKVELIQESRETSREKMLEEKQDFAEKENIFLVLAGSNPNLITEMDESGNPAKFAYDKGKEWEDSQREKLKAQILSNAKNDDVIEETSEKDKRKASALGVPDLTKAASAGANSDPSEIDNKDNLSSVFDE